MKAAPWHLWLVGIGSLLWNAMGAFDYSMTRLRVDAYMNNFTAEQLTFFYGVPTWVNTAWAIGVWFGVMGSVLLLARRRLAIWAFFASFIGIAATTVHNFGLSDVVLNELIGMGAVLFSLSILGVGFLLICYARLLKTRGVLR